MSSCSIKGKEWRAGETSFEHDQDVLMPGFRFHPTEEELVEFYLRRKVEGKHFNIELITSIDLYRYDPWELPALASIGEKEWFFYVKRDRKYRNGDRPNRVTKSGYWKATGADRMILKEFSGCIGSKKTLVFYKGKAPKGKRTGWIMNEYRLPQPQSQRIEKSELSLCRVYERSGGSEDGRQRAKQRHKRTENQENNEMYQCQTYQTCSNLPRTYCNFENKEAGKGEIVKLQEILTGSKAMPKSVMEEKRFGAYMEPAAAVPMEYKVPDLSENIPERIYTEDRNVWSTACGPVAMNEDHELSLTTSFMCPRAPDQLAMAEDLYNITPSNLVLTNALTYGTCLPTYSDKLWEWNAERNNGNGAFY